MKMIAPNIAIPIVKPIAFATLKMRERKSWSGRIGSAARRSCQTKAASRANSHDAEPDDLVRAPVVLGAAPGGEQDQRADTAAEQRGAEVVDAVRPVRRVQMEAGGHDHHRDDADGHVHVEDPAPREMGDEEAAEQRAGHRRDREDRADQAHVATALARRDDVGDDRLRADHEAAGSDSLQGAEADQLGHRLREPREHRAGEEDQDRHEEDGLAPVHVAELAVDRGRDRRRE